MALRTRAARTASPFLVVLCAAVLGAGSLLLFDTAHGSATLATVNPSTITTGWTWGARR